jgi:magnesium chelatase family protein
VAQQDLLKIASGECSAAIQIRVDAARLRQLSRQNKPNAQLSVTELDKFCSPDAICEALLRQAITRLNLSARAYHRRLGGQRSHPNRTHRRGGSVSAHG